MVGPGHTGQGIGACQVAEMGHWSCGHVDEAPRQTRGADPARLS